MDAPARFLRAFAAVTLLGLGGVAAWNYLLDPFDRFGRNWTGVYISAEREMKEAEIGRTPHDAVLLGNSKMALVHTALLPGVRMYNGGFGGATLAEIDAFARSRLGGERDAVIGLDLAQFVPPAPEAVPAVLRGGGFRDACAHLFDARGLEYGWRSLWSRLRREPPTYRREDGSYDTVHSASMERPDPARVRAELSRETVYLEDYVPSEAAVALLAGTVRELNRRGVRVRLFLMPLHPGVAAALLDPDVIRLRAELAARFPGLLDLTEAPFSDAGRFFAADPIHLREAEARAVVAYVLAHAAPVVPADRP